MNKKKFSFDFDKSGLPDDTEFYFTVYLFGNHIAATQSFSKNNRIEYDIYKPGMYAVEVLFRNSTGIYQFCTPYKYIEPENIFDLTNNHTRIQFERTIEKAYTRRNIESLKAYINNQIFNFIYFPSSEQKFYILCPSAIIRSTTPVPYFYRWSWAVEKIFPGNVLIVSDPTFDLDKSVGAGWFVGTKDIDATKNFCEIIKIFCKQLQISFKNLVFWGSSAGGFIAMQFCKYFPGSTAVAVNAQTEIYKFSRYKELYDYGFKGMDEKAVNEQYRPRLSTLEHIEAFRKNSLFLIQNVLDTHHYEEHFKPFIRKAAGSVQSEFPLGIWKVEGYPLTYWLYSHPDGHMAETKEMAKTIFALLEAGNLDRRMPNAPGARSGG